MSTIKIRAKESKGSVTVKALMKHPMETGQRKDKKTGGKIPAHFIQEVMDEIKWKNKSRGWANRLTLVKYL